MYRSEWLRQRKQDVIQAREAVGLAESKAGVRCLELAKGTLEEARERLLLELAEGVIILLQNHEEEAERNTPASVVRSVTMDEIASRLIPGRRGPGGCPGEGGG